MNAEIGPFQKIFLGKNYYGRLLMKTIASDCNHAYFRTQRTSCMLPACCFFFVTGLWIILGLCWADIALQQVCGWSPLGATASDGAGELWVRKDWGEISFRGTTASFRDIQADLALGLNAAFPFEQFGMRPIFPLRLSLGERIFDQKHVVFVSAWLSLPFLILISGFRIGGRKGKLACLLGLICLSIGYLLCRRTAIIINKHGISEAGISTEIIRNGFLTIILVSAFICVFSFAVSLVAGLKGRKGYGSSRQRCSARLGLINAWFMSVVLAIFVGLLAKSFLWLGWYTNDTRVNLLEPLSLLSSFVGVGLFVIAILFCAVIWRKRELRLWNPVALVIGLFVIITISSVWIVPNPPRLFSLSDDYRSYEYVLTTRGELIEYGDWEASIHAQYREILWKLKNRPGAEKKLVELHEIMNQVLKMGKDQQELPLVRSYAFNSANVQSHLFGKVWLQIPLIIFAIGTLGSVIVMSGWVAGTSINAGINAAQSGSWSLLGMVALQWIIYVELALGFEQLASKAIRSHSMDMVLMHTRGDLLEPAFQSLITYKNKDDGSDYWKLPWQVIPSVYLEFDNKFNNLAEIEHYSLHQLGTYGATDNFLLSSDAEFEKRLTNVSAALRARILLFEICEKFPNELRSRLEEEGFHQRLIDAAVSSWIRELTAIRTASLARKQRLKEEYDLLVWMVDNRQNWTATRPGAPPDFFDEEYLTGYVARLSRIVNLKEQEILQTQNLKTRLNWVEPDYSEIAETGLRLLDIQRRFLSYLSDPNLRIGTGAAQFKDPRISEQYTAVVSELEKFNFPGVSGIKSKSATSGRVTKSHR